MIAWARRTVNDSELTKRDRQPATALTVIMALHHRSVEPQARQACYGRGHPVNDSEVTDPDRQPVTDYPLRELISRRSITKAVPMKDPVTGQVKTETITVNGPISLAETTTKGECTVADYRLAHELLSDGVLDNTLNDLPRPARELLELIKKYVTDKADAEGVVAEQVVFQRSQIRAYTSWSSAQVRNNFRTLADYEYIQLIKARSGLANQYRLSAHYSDLDFLTTILSPEDLTARIKAQPAAAGAAT